MKMKKKMLITASTFPRWDGDTEPRFILDYAKAISKYYDVTVLVPGAPKAKDNEIMEGIKVIRYHYFPIKSFETLCYPGAIFSRIKEKKYRALLVPFLFVGLYIKLAKIQNQYDLIHAHWLIPQGIVVSFVKIPYIVTGHGGDVTSLNWGIIKLLKKRCIKHAKAIIVVSELCKQVVESICTNDKTSVISMGCDTSKFSPAYRKDNFFNQGRRKVILFVGRLVEIKGVTYLIEAMSKIDNALLVIVGKGAEEAKLKEQAKQVNDKIVFWGPKTHDELKEIYASADIFVAPSITTNDGAKEGFGLVLVEAMASGIPVVASKTGGIIDIVKDGENGFLVEEKNSDQLAEKIKLLLFDKQIYEKCAYNARITAQKFDYTVVAERYNNLIKMYCREGTDDV